jgi:hypothetical protein
MSEDKTIGWLGGYHQSVNQISKYVTKESNIGRSKSINVGI